MFNAADLPSPETSGSPTLKERGGIAVGTAHSSGESALHALFARSLRRSERVIFPINACALNDNTACPTFYCIHSLSGAGGLDFRDLAKLMPDVRFYGIQAPTKKIMEATFGDSVPAMADYYAQALATFQPNGSFLLGGWSAGAIIGLEIAQNLRARGRDVALFAAIDGAPENTRAGYPPWHPRYVLELVGNLPGWLIHENVISRKALYSLTRRAIKKVTSFSRIKAARRRGEAIVSGHAIEAFLDTSRYPADQILFMKRLYGALFEYRAERYLGRVVVYEAGTKPLTHLPQIARIWRKIAPQSAVVSVEGTHLSILRTRYVPPLAQDLGKRIAEIALSSAVD